MNTILYPAEVRESSERNDDERYCCFVGNNIVALGSDPIFAGNPRDLGVVVREKLQKGWSSIVYNPPVDQIVTEYGKVLSLCALSKEVTDCGKIPSDRELFVNGLLNR